MKKITERRSNRYYGQLIAYEHRHVAEGQQWSPRYKL